MVCLPWYSKFQSNSEPMSQIYELAMKPFKIESTTILTNLNGLYEPETVLIAHFSLTSSPSMFRIHSLNNRLIPKDKLCIRSNLNIEYTSSLKQIFTKRKSDGIGSTVTIDLFEVNAPLAILFLLFGYPSAV